MNPADHQLPTGNASDAAVRRDSRRHIPALAVLALIAVVICVLVLRDNNREPPHLALKVPTPEFDQSKAANGTFGSHPLTPALDFARRVAANLKANVQDYTATVLKQERILGQLSPIEVCSVKIREQPFSAYMKFLAPESLKGQEVIYVEGANDGNMFAHAGGGWRALAGTVQIPPAGPIAMLGQRYPITELGMANLTRRLIEVGEHDLQYGECYVWMDDSAKVGDRPCTSITVMHPVKRKAFIFHIARIFVDNELMVPVHYEAYDWPDKPGGAPLLLERYTYTNLKLNPGMTDADFDPKNPQYNFGLK